VPAVAVRSRPAAALRWRILLGCLVCQMGLGLGGYVFAVFLKPIVTELGWTRTAFAAAGGPFLLAMALASPVVGALTERVGARVVFAIGISGVALGLLLLGTISALWQFYALGFLLGAAATGLGDIPAGAVVTQWFTRRRALALGLVYIGSNIGGMLVPLIATAVTSTSSWRTALWVLAIGGWLLIFPCALWLVRDRREPDAEAAAADDDGAASGLTLAEARRTASFWILAGVLFSFYFYYLGVNHHLVAFLTDQGLSDAEAARRFSAAVAVGIAGKLGIGLLADRLPKQAAIVLNFAVMAAGSIALLFVGSSPGLLPIFLVVHGFTVAAENVLLPAVVAECFGGRHLAQIYGALMLALLPGGMAGNVYAGWAYDVLGSYWIAFATFAVLNVLSVAALVRLRPAANVGRHPAAVVRAN
jgi:MFS family permease